MPTVTIDLPELHEAQRHANTAARFSLFNCGRRFGKDVLMQYRAAKRVATKQPQGWFAPSYRMMTENYNQLYNILAPIVVRANRTDYRLELAGGGVIEFWSLDNYNAARGRKYKHITVNEAAASPDLIDAWNYVIRPTLADLRGGADFGSTPKGLNGFYQLWKQAEDDKEWARYHYTTYDNPYIPVDEIEVLKRTLPERVFQQEILAEFVTDGTYFQRVEERATITEQDTPDQHAGHSIYGGLDFAMAEDYTVLTLGCRQRNRTVAWDRFNQIDYTYQRARIIDFCKRWNLAGLLPERNSIGQPNIELLEAAGLPILRGPDGQDGFNTTATSKPELIQKLASALEHDGFGVPAEYADELKSYEVTTSATGHNKFSAPSGYHDDRVISLALCWWAMTDQQFLLVSNKY